MKTLTKTDELDLINYLKNLFEIPDNVISLQLNLGVNELPRITVEYHPNKNDKST